MNVKTSLILDLAFLTFTQLVRVLLIVTQPLIFQIVESDQLGKAKVLKMKKKDNTEKPE